MIVFGYAKDIAPINFIRLDINLTLDYILTQDGSNVELHMISDVKTNLHGSNEGGGLLFITRADVLQHAVLFFFLYLRAPHVGAASKVEGLFSYELLSGTRLILVCGVSIAFSLLKESAGC